MERTHEDATHNYENKIAFLDEKLRDTIMHYEQLFKEKYEDEIEKRAKKLAQEYIKNDFPFQ